MVFGLTIMTITNLIIIFQIYKISTIYLILQKNISSVFHADFRRCFSQKFLADFRRLKRRLKQINILLLLESFRMTFFCQNLRCNPRKSARTIFLFTLPQGLFLGIHRNNRRSLKFNLLRKYFPVGDVPFGEGGPHRLMQRPHFRVEITHP